MRAALPPPATPPTPAAAAAGPAKPPAIAAKDLPGARLGRDAHGKPGWFIPDPNRPGKYTQVPSHD
jgi:hypothetical protein